LKNYWTRAIETYQKLENEFYKKFDEQLSQEINEINNEENSEEHSEDEFESNDNYLESSNDSDVLI